jgi:hypothetical protein
MDAWITAHVDAVGPVELVHDRPWATVSRVPTPDGVVWFKQCKPVQAFEPRLTVALAERWGDLLPVVIAADEERGWLLLADAGSPLGIFGDPEPWLSVLPRYAELQRGETEHAATHLAAGVPDRTLAAFPALYDDVIERELPISAAEVATLRAFRPRFAELCAELAAHGPEQTIQHDDLHGANVYSRDESPRILDWGDSCVSHPFLAPFVTFMHLAEAHRIDPWRGRLRDAYLEPWGSPHEHRDAFELAQRLGVFAHVFKELRVMDTLPATERAAFGAGLPALLRGCVAQTAD